MARVRCPVNCIATPLRNARPYHIPDGRPPEIVDQPIRTTGRLASVVPRLAERPELLARARPSDPRELRWRRVELVCTGRRPEALPAELTVSEWGGRRARGPHLRHGSMAMSSDPCPRPRGCSFQPA